jgi:hypothetical protein
MRTKIARCTVLEVAGTDGGNCLDATAQPVVRDLLPWADPYIAKLLARHRLQAALDDSLTYLKDDRHGHEMPAPSNRFALPGTSHWDA